MSTDEDYVHYQESITCLNRAWRTACELEDCERGSSIWSAAYRMTLIEYCKPFKVSYGSNNKKMKISMPRLDTEKDRLHKTILGLRDQVLAHSDINVLDATISYDSSSKFPVPLIVTNSIKDMPSPLEVRQLIEFVLDELYHQQETYNESYAKNP